MAVCEFGSKCSRTASHKGVKYDVSYIGVKQNKPHWQCQREYCWMIEMSLIFLLAVG